MISNALYHNTRGCSSINSANLVDFAKLHDSFLFCNNINCYVNFKFIIFFVLTILDIAILKHIIDGVL